MSVVGHGFLSRSYLALCMLKLHVVKHKPGLRQRLSRPLRTPWMRCVVGTKATRHGGASASQGAQARARTTYFTEFTRTQTHGPGHLHTLGCLVPSALRASARGRDERWLVRVPGPTRDGRFARRARLEVER